MLSCQHGPIDADGTLHCFAFVLVCWTSYQIVMDRFVGVQTGGAGRGFDATYVEEVAVQLDMSGTKLHKYARDFAR